MLCASAVTPTPILSASASACLQTQSNQAFPTKLERDKNHKPPDGLQ